METLFCGLPKPRYLSPATYSLEIRIAGRRRVANTAAGVNRVKTGGAHLGVIRCALQPPWFSFSVQAGLPGCVWNSWGRFGTPPARFGTPRVCFGTPRVVLEFPGLALELPGCVWNSPGQVWNSQGVLWNSQGCFGTPRACLGTPRVCLEFLGGVLGGSDTLRNREFRRIWME